MDEWSRGGGGDGGACVVFFPFSRCFSGEKPEFVSIHTVLSVEGPAPFCQPFLLSRHTFLSQFGKYGSVPCQPVVITTITVFPSHTPFRAP